MNTKKFIEKSKKIHNDKYDYSETFFTNYRTKLKIICSIHGEFYQLPQSHLKGCGCSKCKGFKKTTEEFVKQAIEIHGNKYNYSKSEYKNSKTKLTITCLIHGDFSMSPHLHISGQSGCPLCSKERTLKNIINNSNNSRTKIEDFISKSNIIHNNKYEYENIIIKNLYQKIKIKCPIHGWFEQTIASHLKGHGCKECFKIKRGETQRMNILDFINKANKIHNNKYNYSFVKYKNNNTKVKIECPIHGIFYQIPNSHLMGCGCPACNSSKGEVIIKMFLGKNNINFIPQKTFAECKDKKMLQFDFYLPDYNICIEYDGMQHFKVIEYFGGEDGLKNIQKKDKIKNNFCLNNNIPLLRIKYNEKIENKLQKFLSPFF